MDSPVSLSPTSDTAPLSPPGSVASELPPTDQIVSGTDQSTSHRLGSEWDNNTSVGWGIPSGWENNTWGRTPYTTRWGTEHLTRSTVLQTVRSDFHSANLTAAGTEDRNTSLDGIDNRGWSSIQLYRTSEQGRRDGAPHPTFTLSQVEQRCQEVQTAIHTLMQEKEVLAGEIDAMTKNLADKKRNAKNIDHELIDLKYSLEELRDLQMIAHARLP
ncbi:hypothetical protein FB446DRAFT_795986 [Lentinula raphanica]|uniref:Uncharacterized protein n=1 Tax=Lentinula raphanica TaxID=153919 RepID=A0AA38P020_9AGAR|nr:hypothetical protein C8R42DRAFT_729421 [Lentinula raphanica]KAJ3717361.1 hypothetical protein C8R42DRAFT_644615 [Lentinula raphanica]KAJ3729249.1 hypothetical protein C8R42DRAFT_637528 [Lentinula raphanica]KAJ3764589.1 hypothetical protein FB446DRAFT_795986 [Lentinula raphanica]KAJ3833813.1 hypothetical protein F5878DRAFT_665324 [Lentinula raphanica]